MSRPFSYNDENFTVIGNMLLVHIIDNKARKKFEPVVEIPPAIFERLKTYTNPGFVSTSEEVSSIAFATFIIKNFENKHYIVFQKDIQATNVDRLFWSIYFLKDI